MFTDTAPVPLLEMTDATVVLLPPDALNGVLLIVSSPAISGAPPAVIAPTAAPDPSPTINCRFAALPVFDELKIPHWAPNRNVLPVPISMFCVLFPVLALLLSSVLMSLVPTAAIKMLVGVAVLIAARTLLVALL